MSPAAVTEIAAEYRIQDIGAKKGHAACRVSEIAGFVAGLKLCGQMTPHLEAVVQQVTREITRKHYREQELKALKHDAETKAARAKR